MFDTLPISHLESMLNHLPVPMLIAERPDSSTDFRLVSVNMALEELLGPDNSGCGTNLRLLFPPTFADDMVQSFHLCGTTQKTHRFNSVLCGAAQDIPCDLTLQYLHRPDGVDRVIATAHQTQGAEISLPDRLAFEDVRYFSFIADLQLENLNSAFGSTSELIAVDPINDDRFMRLHAVCRTIQRTVSDIKKVVEDAQARHASQKAVQTSRSQQPSKCAEMRQGMDAFDALTGNCEAEKQQQTH